MIQTISFDPFWVEEPCHPEDYAAYKAVADATPVRIAAGEQEGTVWGFEHLIREGGVNVAAGPRTGGFTAAPGRRARGGGRTFHSPARRQSDLVTAASFISCHSPGSSVPGIQRM
jgi:hypothetical protein